MLAGWRKGGKATEDDGGGGSSAKLEGGTKILDLVVPAFCEVIFIATTKRCALFNLRTIY